MQLPQLDGEDRADSAPTARIEFEIVRDTEGLRALETDWQRLWKASAGDFLVYSYPVIWRTWKQVLEPLGHTPHVIVGRLDGRAVLIWPAMILAEKLHGAWRLAGWLGRDPIDYGEVLLEPTADNEQWMEAALAKLIATAKVDFLALESVRSDARVRSVLERACRWRVKEDPSPYLDLRGLADGDALEAKLPKRFRQGMRRRARRIAEVGEVRFEFERNPEWLADTIAWIVKHKQVWVNDRGMVGAGLTDAHANSMVDIFQDVADENPALVARLWVGDALIAADISLIAGNRLYSDYGSFDMELGKYSPGSLLLRETIKWAIDNGMEIFDLARGPDEYKIKWSDGTIELTRYLIPCTLFGRIYVVLRTSRVHKWFRWAKAKIKKQSGAEDASGGRPPADAAEQ